MHFFLLGGGWAISLIWAMMILPLADSLMNCLQNLTSRIAGVDNEQMTGRVMGMGAMFGYGIGAIKEQFNSPSSNTKTGNSNTDNNNSGGGLKGFVTRAKSVVNPDMNLSAEKDYNGNVNPIRNVMPKENKQITIPKSNENNKQNISNGNKINSKAIVTGVAKTGLNATKTYLKAGANLAEGNFNNDFYKSKTPKKNNLQDTEYINKSINDNSKIKSLGDGNES